MCCIGSCDSFCPPFFFFNDTATTEIYTLSLHDALPICTGPLYLFLASTTHQIPTRTPTMRDRKSTRLNSSHSQISYAVFCLKKKKIMTPLSLRRSHNVTDCSLERCHRASSPTVPSPHYT